MHYIMECWVTNSFGSRVRKYLLPYSAINDTMKNDVRTVMRRWTNAEVIVKRRELRPEEQTSSVMELMNRCDQGLR